MFTVNNFDYDCTKKCKNCNHGRLITSALTKRSVTDKNLATYIAKICRNFSEILDNEGRSALHLASSCNRYVIAEWLINQGANVTLKDVESGHTPLHRAIYYGCINIAVLLQKYGGSLNTTDEDFLNPLQYLCKNRTRNDENRMELMTWGKNKNYNLGIGNSQGKDLPEYNEYFRKHKIKIKKVSLNSYHSLFITNNGDLYSAGHGNGGRLGCGTENTLVVPHQIMITRKQPDEIVIDVSAGKYHSLVLTNYDTILSCGLNTYSQLGVKPPPEKLLSLREINGLQNLSGKNIKRVIAKNYHSIAVGQYDVFVWGLNGGQFGIKKETDSILLPKPLVLDAHKTTPEIKLVESSNAAIVCYTNNCLYIYYKYKLRTFKNPLMETFECISVSGGEFTPKQASLKIEKEKELRIIVNTEGKNLYIWYEEMQQFLRCFFPMNMNLSIENIMWSGNNIMASMLGHIYIGTIANKINNSTKNDVVSEYQETSTKKELSVDFKSKIELKRVNGISDVSMFTCDPEGENFAALVEPIRDYLQIPELKEEDYNFDILLTDGTEISDVTFIVDNIEFPVHKFIIYSRCEHLKKVIEKSKNKNITLNYPGLNSKMFEFVLRYIYKTILISPEDIKELEKFAMVRSNENDRSNLLMVFKKVLNKMGLYELSGSLKNPERFLGKKFGQLSRTDHSELYDVTIKLERNDEIQAHKCILVSRLEYFNMMFIHNWAESKVVNLTTIPLEYMEPILDYLYSNNYDIIKSQKFSENFLYNMITICDQFFVDELKRVFEVMISDRLNLKNCSEILEFATLYNCSVLKSITLQFITLNISKILESRILENLESSVLEQLNAFYRTYFDIECYRVITPNADAIPDDELEIFIEDFEIDLNFKQDQLTKQKNKAIKIATNNKMNRLSQDRRNHEKEAMEALKDLSVNDENIILKKENNVSSLIGEVKEINNKFDKVSTIWTKVADKKENKKKPAGLKTNEILKNESKDDGNFVNLNSFLNKENEQIRNTSSPISSPNFENDYLDRNGSSNRASICLGDFTPQKHLSQKQRKRLSSTGEPCNLPTISPVTSVFELTPKKNPWNTSVSENSSNNSFAELLKSPTNITSKSINIPRKSGGGGGKLNESPSSVSSSFIKSSSPSQPAQASSVKKSTATSFTAILEDERKQKLYYEKTKTKSLILTQIEEKAIEELKEFYNIEGVFDEDIQITRVKRLNTNFAVWQYNQNT